MANMSTTLILFSIIFGVFALTNGSTVDLIHPNSPENPFRDPSETRFDYIRRAARESRTRAASISRRINGGISTNFATDLKSAGGGYVMKYSIGTPAFVTYGIADTGSDITWTQCKPCENCFDQALPIFDPKRSRSYKTVSCDDEICDPNSFKCDDSNMCQYQVTYGDRSQTYGDVAMDTLRLGNSSFKNVLFGCGHDNSGTFGNGTSGIVGLGGNGATSIIAQLDEQIGGKFSYCLSDNPNATSHIKFGREAVVVGPEAVSTPIFKRPSMETFYFLNLEAISVGSKRINVGQPTERLGRRLTFGGRGNIIIDSGTTLTFLPNDIYDGFVSAVAKTMKAKQTRDPSGTFDLCYRFNPEKRFDVPKIVAHFTGADVVLSPSGTFLAVSEDVVCLGFMSESAAGIAIFGNLSELDHVVGYDLVKNTVTFMPSDCSKY